MNHNFDVIFNGSPGTSQVVSEQSRGKGKSKTVRGTDNAAKMTKSAIAAASALVLGLALAPTARAATVSVTFDGVDQGATSISPQSALGISGYPHTVVVDGVGADWTPGGLSFGSVIVGDAGTASLSILNGGTVHATGGGVGDNGGDGTLNIDGVGSRLISTGGYYIGGSGAGTVNITNGGTLSGVSFIGGVGSTGTVTVDGAASLLTSNGSSLIIGSDGIYAGAGAVTIQNGGKVSVGDLQLGYAGSGSATVNLNANGVLETDHIAKNSSQATLNFNGGILRATADQANLLQGFSSGDITIAGGGAVIDTQNFNVGIASVGVFNGNGGLTKQGSGTLAIAGPNSWDGDTRISAGTLRLDSYTQGSGKTLGIGVAGTSNYGKLNVTGTATFNAGANLAVDVAGVNSLANGQTLGSVISAGTLNASTFNVTDNSALFDFQAVVNGSQVDLKIVATSTTPPPTDSSDPGAPAAPAVPAPPFSGVSDAVLAGGISSAAEASRILDSLISATAGGDMGTVITALGRLSTQRDVGRAAAQTLPLNSGVAQSMLGMLGSFNHVVQNRLAYAADGNASIAVGDADNVSGIAAGERTTDRHVWAKAFGSRADQDDHSGTSGFSANSWGTAFGVDSEVSPGVLFGLTYAYANSSIDGNTALSGAAQHARVDSHVLGIYGSKALPNEMQLDFQADIGRSHTDGSRDIVFGGLNRTARSSYATYSAHVGTGLSKDIALTGRTTVTPDVRADYTQLRGRGYSESGADALNLNVDAGTIRAFVLSVGGRVRHALSNHAWLSANLGAGYDTINDRGNLVSVYAGAPGQSFTTTGIDHSPWLVNAGVGYTYAANSGMQVVLRYDVDGRSGYVNQTASVKAGWVF